jgi:hypothetical protein
MKTRRLNLSIIVLMIFLCLMGCATDNEDREPIPTSPEINEEPSEIEGSVTDEPLQETGGDMGSQVNSISPDAAFTVPTVVITAENIDQLIPVAVRNMGIEDFTYLDIAPSADLLAVTTSTRVEVYQLSTFELLTQIDYPEMGGVSGGDLFSATFSPDGNFLALYNDNDDGSTFIQVLDTQTWTPVEFGAIKDEARVNNARADSLVFFADNQYMLLSGLVANLHETDPVAALNFEPRLSSSLSISYDQGLIAGIGPDIQTLSVMRLEELPNEVVFEYAFPKYAQHAVFSPVSHVLAASSFGELMVWDVDTGEPVFQYSSPFGDFDFQSMSFSSDGSLLFVDQMAFDLVAGQEVSSPIQEYLWQNGMFSLGSNQEGTLLITAQWGQIIYWGIK